MFVENLGNMDTPEVQKTFSIPDYAVFAGMLMISTTIGVYYAWKVSFVYISKARVIPLMNTRETMQVGVHDLSKASHHDRH